MIPTLFSMGIKKAFHETEAEIPNMIIGKDVYINHAIQATVFKVDELGAEASAVTSVGGYETDVNPFGKITLVVDRPFIFFVKEQSTETILFAGKMGEI
jgi:serpin B